jgi:hypothetical protein
MQSQHPQPELHYIVNVTPSEIIAMNVAINFFLRHYRPVRQDDYELICSLLARYRQRLEVLNNPPRATGVLDSIPDDPGIARALIQQLRRARQPHPAQS